MQLREFPVLGEDDDELVDRLALGLGEGTARVLAYLLLREGRPEFDDPATRLAIRIGTGASRSAVTDAVERLTDRGLVAETTVSRDVRGRPPKAWSPAAGREGTLRRVDDAHGLDLVAEAVRVAEALGVDARIDAPPDPTAGAGDYRRLDAGGASVTVGLNWHPNPFHAPLFAAAADGVYRDRGLAVDLDPYEGSGRALGALRAGDVDVALAGAATTVRTLADGAALVPLAPLFQRAMTVLYTTREVFGEELERADQLRGCRVGMPGGSETELLGRLFLSQSGLFETATLVDVAGEEREALRTGRADAVTGMFSDPRGLADEGATVDVLPVADHFPIYGPTLVTTPATLRDRGPALAALLGAAVAGRATVTADPTAAVRAVHRRRTAGTAGAGNDALAAAGNAGTDRRDDPAVERDRRDLLAAVERFGGGSAVSDHGWGWHRAEEWHRLRTALDQADLL